MTALFGSSIGRKVIRKEVAAGNRWTIMTALFGSSIVRKVILLIACIL